MYFSILWIRPQFFFLFKRSNQHFANVPEDRIPEGAPRQLAVHPDRVVHHVDYVGVFILADRTWYTTSRSFSTERAQPFIMNCPLVHHEATTCNTQLEVYYNLKRTKQNKTTFSTARKRGCRTPEISYKYVHTIPVFINVFVGSNPSAIKSICSKQHPSWIAAKHETDENTRPKTFHHW